MSGTELPERELDVTQLQNALALIGRLEEKQRQAHVALTELKTALAHRLVRVQHPGPLTLHEATVLLRSHGAEPRTTCNCPTCEAVTRKRAQR